VRSVPWLKAQAGGRLSWPKSCWSDCPPSRYGRCGPLVTRWKTPSRTLAGELELREAGRGLKRDARIERILEVAERLADNPEKLDDDEAIRRIPGVNQAVAALAVLAVPIGSGGTSEEPVLARRGVLRAVARFTGQQVDQRNRLTDGRVGVARMIGRGSDAREAHLGLIELSAAVCRPADPACVKCPLSESCRGSRAVAQRESLLF